MKNILHLSDFHISDGGRGFSPNAAKRIVRSLKLDIEENNKQISGKIDTLFITGDLSFSGKSKELELFKDLVLDEIVNHFSISQDQIFIVPGNHDCDREKISRIEKPFREKQDLAELDDLCKDIQKDKETWSRIDAFNDWFSVNFNKNENLKFQSKLTKIYEITKNLYVVAINSAWMAQDDSDHGNLIIGSSQLKIIKEKVPSDAKIILLMHHPMDWLHPEENKRFSEFVEKRISALCFGHMHEFRQTLEANFQYDITLRLQAGTFDSRHENPGYSILSLNKENDISYGEVFYRKYNKVDRKFEAWAERGNGGVFPFSTNGDLTFDKNKFSNLSKDKLEDLNNSLIVNLGVSSSARKNIIDLFVEPSLAISQSEELINTSSKPRTVDDVLNHDGICFVYAGQNEGKSFFIDYILAKGLDRQSHKNFDKIVLKLDALDDDLQTESKILKKLAGFYFDKDISTSFDGFIRDNVKNGNALILVDNFCKSQSRRELLDFSDKYHNCSFVYACSSNTEMEIIQDIRRIDRKDLAFVSLGGIRRKNVRQMISKWSALSSIGSEKKVYESLMKVINKSQLPHNNFTYSMLLAIYENEKELSKIFNESDIIENFMEILLSKHNMNRPSNKPQYKDLLRFMAFLAKESVLHLKYSFTRNELMDVAKDYNEKTFHDFDYEDYFLPLISAGILKPEENAFVFFQSCFLDFGIAHYMGMDESFKELIINEMTYLKYNRIIEYFACQNPSNEGLLDFVSARVAELRSEISDLVKDKYKIDINKIDYEKMDEFSVLDLAASSEKFEGQLSEIKADRDKHDEMMDTVEPLESDRGKVNSETHSDKLQSITSLSNSEQKLREAVSLYGRINRNMEAVVNAKVVMGHFEKLVDGYMFLVKFNIARMDDKILIPLIAPKLDEYFNREGLDAKSKEQRLSTIKGFISLVRGAIPSMVQAQMTEDLSSKKPRIINIINMCADKSADELSFAMLKYVLIDLEKFNYKKDLHVFREMKSKFVKSTVFFKLLQVVMVDYELVDNDRATIEKFVKRLVHENRDLYRDVSTVSSLSRKY